MTALVALVQVGGYTVTVYESLMEHGRVVIDVDSLEVPEDDTCERVAIAVNDHYVHGGPANTDEGVRP